ncbi:MAG: alpha/beta fold hydrolase [Limisphaerales bacterium]
MNDSDPGELQIRIHGDASLPTLVYLPGLHGDWTLIASFRAAVAGRTRFVEFTYPRTLTWSLEDYAQAVEAALLANGISRGWLLGESFGSQLAWLLCGPAARFRADGLILAGGFVRYPARWRVPLARRICRHAPLRGLQMFLRFYAWFARFRHRHAPETRAAIGEFVARRTDLDRRAMAHRLACVETGDPCPIAREARLPVFHIAGLLDPVVPARRVRRWLRLNCPGFRGGKTIWHADHNVLSTAPIPAATQILSWIDRTRGA